MLTVQLEAEISEKYAAVYELKNNFFELNDSCFV